MKKIFFISLISSLISAQAFATLTCDGATLVDSEKRAFEQSFESKTDCLRSVRNQNQGLVCVRKYQGYRPTNIETLETYGSSFSRLDDCLSAVRFITNGKICSDDFNGYRVLDIELNTGHKTFFAFDRCLEYLGANIDF